MISRRFGTHNYALAHQVNVRPRLHFGRPKKVLPPLPEEYFPGIESTNSGILAEFFWVKRYLSSGWEKLEKPCRLKIEGDCSAKEVEEFLRLATINHPQPLASILSNSNSPVTLNWRLLREDLKSVVDTSTFKPEDSVRSFKNPNPVKYRQWRLQLKSGEILGRWEQILGEFSKHPNVTFKEIRNIDIPDFRSDRPTHYMISWYQSAPTSLFTRTVFRCNLPPHALHFAVLHFLDAHVDLLRIKRTKGNRKPFLIEHAYKTSAGSIVLTPTKEDFLREEDPIRFLDLVVRDEDQTGSPEVFRLSIEINEKAGPAI